MLILAVAGVTLNALRSLQFRRSAGGSEGSQASIRTEGSPEPAARRLLRISFGLIWIFDGILQGQSSMPLGMVPQVVRPTTAASPTWVQHLVNAGATVWSYHPVQAAAAAVWIQIGIGLWLLVVPTRGVVRGRRSGERRVGSRRVGVRRVLRRDLRPRSDVALRRPGRGALLLRRRRPHRPARAGLGHTSARSHRPACPGGVLRRHGPAPGLARPGLLERTDPIGRCGHARRDGPADGPDTSASGPLLVGDEFRVVRRSPRVGRQPLRRDRLGRDRWRLPQRSAPRRPRRPVRRCRALSGRLGADRGLRFLRWGRHRPQQHDSDGSRVHCRVSGSDQASGR